MNERELMRRFDAAAFREQRRNGQAHRLGTTLSGITHDLTMASSADLLWHFSVSLLPVARILMRRYLEGNFQIHIHAWVATEPMTLLMTALLERGLDPEESAKVLFKGCESSSILISDLWSEPQDELYSRIPCLFLDRSQINVRAFFLFPELEDDCYVFEMPPVFREHMLSCFREPDYRKTRLAPLVYRSYGDRSLMERAHKQARKELKAERRPCSADVDPS